MEGVCILAVVLKCDYFEQRRREVGVKIEFGIVRADCINECT
jgi:hypothetical protein